MQADGIVARDFLMISTANFRCLTGFAVMEPGRRWILSVGVTWNLTWEWAASRLRTAVAAAPRAAEFLIHDRNTIYGLHFYETAEALGLQEIVTAYRAPKMNAHSERRIGTLRRGLLDQVIEMGESHARSLLAECADHYNTDRCHRGPRRGSHQSRRPDSSPGRAEWWVDPSCTDCTTSTGGRTRGTLRGFRDPQVTAQGLPAPIILVRQASEHNSPNRKNYLVGHPIWSESFRLKDHPVFYGKLDERLRN